MPVINLLSPHVADLIAAGEVVERPASVIKELIENAFDAGAKNITVEIRDGGATCIRVTDDGCGMAPEDAGVAFLRHATSKLHDERGLEAIETMGFRGEALAAIAAVSRISLQTRLRGSAEGTRVTLEAGDIQEMGACGCPEGTSMTVRDLFFNTPARLKFLKSDRSEASACVAAALRCALGRPEVSVRMLRDGREEFFTPGDGRASSCVYTLLGRDIASTLLEVNSSDELLSVTGFTSSPAAGRGSRGAQFFFCNGRVIKSALLQAAVEQAYKNTLLTGRYPACVLYLRMRCGSVDVNVHPAKTEVKFSYEKRVFDLVYHAVLLALEAEDRGAPAADLAPRPAAVPTGHSIPDASPTERRIPDAPPTERRIPDTRPAKPPVRAAAEPLTLRDSGAAYQTRLPLDVPAVPPASSVSVSVPSPPFDAAAAASTAFPPAAGPQFVENPVQNVESPPVPDHKIVGEALKTYLIVETDGALILIDKHAAHERMIFDRLRAQKREILSQQLLEPVTLRLDGEEAELIEQNDALLRTLGFVIEPFGERDYIVRAVPADMLPSDARAAVEEICDRLRRGRSLDAQGARDEILHTVACKAAIKAGWDTDARELARIAEEVLSGRVKYCPHGRPVSVVMTRRELDRQFKRLV